MGILTAAVPSIRARMCPYRVARMPNHLRRGHVLAKKWGAMAAPAAPAVQHCKFFNTDLSAYLLGKELTAGTNNSWEFNQKIAK